MHYLQLCSPDELPDISALRPFKTVVIVEDDVTSDRQVAVSRWLVESGCLYMMAWGRDCGSWCDVVERTNAEAFDTAEIPDDCLIITTSHQDESLEELFWYSKFSAMHPCFRLENILLLHLSPTEREHEFCNSYMAV